MTIMDPIADMLTRVRNALARRYAEVVMPSSKMKIAVAEVLKSEGFISGFSVTETDGRLILTVSLKYAEGKPAIRSLRRASRPGLRMYRGKDELPRVLGGFGVAIVSTPQGVMSDRAARRAGVGGEVLCLVS
ncbi:30S ribosomal protein S8 [Immundisolibacter sp.]|jgi:small subunit ribosomal protein S8|uniref:30S ribosomal protein S8 n=1 Tax=Immundisolibacter sp. TaxID=1934948 RepID=UPI00198950A7|nr:30S ribosomal protein S8 [Immundisolibacter sp.]MBC7161184.1 30S ribosomal protein S8 [Immundisolibacter sp.]MEA3219286.1 30S ribosomal protein S8 [Immundisolibacter sp.]